MKVLIIEDEYHAAERLKKLLKSKLPEAQIIGPIDSVEDSVSWLKDNEAPDIIFMDIQLADGISFSIFEQIEVEAPVIFTTAFDEYSLRAFKVNSIDYLMKPIDEEELSKAIKKFEKYRKQDSVNLELNSILKNFNQKSPYKSRFLIKRKDEFTYLLSEQIAYFYSEESVTFIVDKTGKNHIYDQTLNQIEENLEPKDFFRINRKQIIHVQSIGQIHSYFNNRIKLDLIPASEEEVIVSREKVKAFKGWLDR